MTLRFLSAISQPKPKPKTVEMMRRLFINLTIVYPCIVVCLFKFLTEWPHKNGLVVNSSVKTLFHGRPHNKCPCKLEKQSRSFWHRAVDENLGS